LLELCDEHRFVVRVQAAIQIHQVRDVVGDGFHDRAARGLAVGPARHAVGDERDVAARLANQGGDVLGRQAGLVDPQQFVEARDEELILVL